MLCLLVAVPVMLCVVGALAAPATAVGKIQTVCGPIDPAELGPALTHEHILVDFIGADSVSPDRYDPEEVYEVMLPYVEALREAGIRALFECTPNYLGRDPVLLRRLSQATGIHIITNTGLYKDRYLPAWAKELPAEEIARRWIEEAVEGIGPERIKPGFIKIAANEGDLNEIQRKILHAAALTSRATGLVIASHTTQGATALQQLDFLQDLGVPASRFIWVHADAEPDPTLHYAAARRGAWLSYDGIRPASAADRLPLVMETLRRFPDRLLISQDAGWYNVGQPRGGQVTSFDWLPRAFIPMLVAAGVSAEGVNRLLVQNPAAAFTIRAADE